MKNISLKIFGLIFLVAGCFVIKSGITAHIENNKFIDNAKETIGIVTEIQAFHTGGSSSKYYEIAHVAYEVDGKKYENKFFNLYYSGINEGSPIKIHYNPDNPTDFEVFTAKKEGLVGIIAGALFAFVGIMILFSNKLNKKEEKEPEELNFSMMGIEEDTIIDNKTPNLNQVNDIQKNNNNTMSIFMVVIPIFIILLVLFFLSGSIYKKDNDIDVLQVEGIVQNVENGQDEKGSYCKVQVSVNIDGKQHLITPKSYDIEDIQKNDVLTVNYKPGNPPQILSVVKVQKADYSFMKEMLFLWLIGMVIFIIQVAIVICYMKRRRKKKEVYDEKTY